MKKSSTADAIDTISEQWQACGLDTDYNAIQIIARILRLSKALESRLTSLHLQFELSQGEFDVLAAVKRANTEALTPSALYQSLLLSSGAMTSRLDRLESKNLIKRTHCNRDRRSVKVSLTAEGNALIDKVVPAHFHLIATLLSSMNESDKSQLSQLLRACLQQVESQADNAS